MGILSGLATSLIGGIGKKLFGGSKQKWRPINYSAMRDAAIKGGFNPLTALQATGGAGYVAQSGPSLSTADFISDGLSEGFDNLFDPEGAKRKKELEDIRYEMAKEELENLRKQNDAFGQNFGYSIPQLEDNPAATERPKLERGRETVTNHTATDSGQWVDPHQTDTEVAEARRGDLLSLPHALKGAHRDRTYSAMMNSMGRMYGKEFRDGFHAFYQKHPTKGFDELFREYRDKNEHLMSAKGKTYMKNRRERRNRGEAAWEKSSVAP